MSSVRDRRLGVMLCNVQSCACTNNEPQFLDLYNLQCFTPILKTVINILIFVIYLELLVGAGKLMGNCRWG